jgi:hypothetical protein
MVAGFQVPVIGGVLVELAGRAGAVDPWHSGPIWVNVGVMELVTTILIVAVVAH